MQRLSYIFSRTCFYGFIIWMFVALYTLHPYISSLFPSNIRDVFVVCAMFYTLCIPLYLAYITTDVPSPRDILSKVYAKGCTMSTELSHLMRVIAVKAIFIPLMIHFLYVHLHAVYDISLLYPTAKSVVHYLWNYGFGLAFHTLFLIDVVIFLMAYLLDSAILKNNIRSVDSTCTGWLVCLICYSPLNTLTAHVLPLSKDTVHALPEFILITLKIAMIVCLIWYVASSVALGLKSGNLVNRGIVRRGPYAYVRHPAYISKNLFWILEYIPYMTYLAAFSLIGWVTIYILRALTEERHLVSDADYRAYTKRVPYRFIPRVW